jgi:hypothetical protein
MHIDDRRELMLACICDGGEVSNVTARRRSALWQFKIAPKSGSLKLDDILPAAGDMTFFLLCLPSRE